MKPVYVERLRKLRSISVDLQKPEAVLKELAASRLQNEDKTHQQLMQEIEGEKVAKPYWPKMLAAQGAWSSIPRNQRGEINQAIKNTRGLIHQFVAKDLVASKVESIARVHEQAGLAEEQSAQKSWCPQPPRAATPAKWSRPRPSNKEKRRSVEFRKVG